MLNFLNAITMKKFFLCLTILLSVWFTNAQDTLVKPSAYRFVFQMDNRFSSLHGINITIIGGKAGVQYKKLFRLGLGSSFIVSPVDIVYVNRKTNALIENKVSFWYVSVFNDWILYKNKHWECFLTEQVGFGKPSFVREVNDAIVSDINIPLYVNEVSGQVNYKITNWIGIGAGFGYRNIWNSKSALKNTFNAPIYIGKLILYPQAVFNKSRQSRS